MAALWVVCNADTESWKPAVSVMGWTGAREGWQHGFFFLLSSRLLPLLLESLRQQKTTLSPWTYQPCLTGDVFFSLSTKTSILLFRTGSKLGTTEGFVQITEVPQLLWESASMFSLLVKSARSSWTLLLTCILGKKRLKQKDNGADPENDC